LVFERLERGSNIDQLLDDVEQVADAAGLFAGGAGGIASKLPRISRKPKHHPAHIARFSGARSGKACKPASAR
jgi:hypothetical protein